MANFHLTMKVYGRSKGQSAVASAAYRAGMLGEAMVDEETGQIIDFSRKKGVVSSKIYLPKGAPLELLDRSKLWNVATRAELRKNSTLAREIEFSLPHEVNDASRERLIERVAIEIVEKHGCAVDANQHAPSLKRGHQEDGALEEEWISKNFHVHLLMTTRVLGPSGFGRKTRELDRRASKEVDYWRARVAALINEAYVEAGLPMRVDHRSFKERGILRVPQRHRGPAVSEMIRRGRSNASYVLKRQLKQEVHDQEEMKEVEQLRSLDLEIERDRQEIQKLVDQSIDEKYAAVSMASTWTPSASTTDVEKEPAPSPDLCADDVYVVDFDAVEQKASLLIDQSEEYLDLDEEESQRYNQRE
jgi:ATP-dependent exoDNAse (exonuclease V) alpha subunit